MSQAAAPSAVATPGASLVPDTTEMFTAAHLVWIVLFAAVAIAVIVWGMRQKARRRSADREIAEHNAELRDQPPAPAPIPAALAAPPPAPGPITSPAPSQPVAAPPAEPTPLPPIASEPDVVPLGPAPAPAATIGPADGPVTQMKGLGPKVAARLAELGVTTVGQIAALSDDEAAALDARLGTFSGRMARDRWQEQARFLAAGDRAGFEAVFGKLS